MRHFLLLCGLLLWGGSLGASKPSLLLMDAKTGVVLSQTRGDLKRFPASLTKLMTLYIVFEKLKNGCLDPKEKIRFTPHACRVPPSKLYIRPKGTMTVLDAAIALAVKSANDVARALAEHISGTEYKFSLLMNKKAKALGMKHTLFKNASGLPNRHQVSTARDMAVLSKALLDHHPEYKYIFGLKSFLFRGRRYKNTNPLLGTMKGVDGMKTGYTRAAGWNLVATYHRGKDYVIGVVMGAKNKGVRSLYMRQLLEGRKLTAREIRRIKNPKKRFIKMRGFTRWGVQVGVFKSAKKARQFARQVKRKNRSVLKPYPFRVVASFVKRRRNYKVRFDMKSRQVADKTCTALKRCGVSCFVVRR